MKRAESGKYLLMTYVYCYCSVADRYHVDFALDPTFSVDVNSNLDPDQIFLHNTA